jgi:hypothetical protein
MARRKTMKQVKKKIMYESPEAAQLKTVTGWVSSSGHFYGDNEHSARYDGSTHKLCECGNEHTKTYTMCAECRTKKEIERFHAKEFKVWEGEPLCLDGSDEYFFDEDALFDYCADNNVKSDDLHLVICDPNYASEVDEERWYDELPEDQYLHDVAPDISEALERLNKVIRESNTILSWFPGKYRTTIKMPNA